MSNLSAKAVYANARCVDDDFDLKGVACKLFRLEGAITRREETASGQRYWIEPDGGTPAESGGELMPIDVPSSEMLAMMGQLLRVYVLISEAGDAVIVRVDNPFTDACWMLPRPELGRMLRRNFRVGWGIMGAVFATGAIVSGAAMPQSAATMAVCVLLGGVAAVGTVISVYEIGARRDLLRQIAQMERSVLNA